MRLEDLNALDQESATRELLRCCGSSRWARLMAAARPFRSVGAMALAADAIWSALDRDGWLEAFAAHPKIGTGGPRGFDAGARRLQPGARSDGEGGSGGPGGSGG